LKKRLESIEISDLYARNQLTSTSQKNEHLLTGIQLSKDILLKLAEDNDNLKTVKKLQKKTFNFGCFQRLKPLL
jgi:hypothetical protein